MIPEKPASCALQGGTGDTPEHKKERVQSISESPTWNTSETNLISAVYWTL